MAKKLKIYERFLLAVMFCADTMADIYKSGSTSCARSHFLSNLFSSWGPIGYKPSNYYNTYSRLLKTGYIEKIIKNNKPYLRLTNQGKEKLKRDFPIFTLQRKKWDGKWRIVIFDIKEKSKYLRRILREKLKELGFGMWQKSVYISPHDFADDMYEFLKTQKLLGKAYVFTIKHQRMGDSQDLVNNIWEIDQLEEEYINLWQNILDLREKKDKKKEIVEIKNKYLEIMQKDPCLPLDLLPPDWIGEEVRKTVVRL